MHVVLNQERGEHSDDYGLVPVHILCYGRSAV